MKDSAFYTTTIVLNVLNNNFKIVQSHKANENYSTYFITLYSTNLVKAEQASTADGMNREKPGIYIEVWHRNGV
ncbi:MAG: hypothetical protein Q8903_00370 [Bacteroidota bacterium]|nr:hypothetical protein [Bacteroidota bacterium]